MQPEPRLAAGSKFELASDRQVLPGNTSPWQLMLFGGTAPVFGQYVPGEGVVLAILTAHHYITAYRGLEHWRPDEGLGPTNAIADGQRMNLVMRIPCLQDERYQRALETQPSSRMYT